MKQQEERRAIMQLFDDKISYKPLHKSNFISEKVTTNEMFALIFPENEVNRKSN